MGRGPSSINFVSIFLAVALTTGVYLSYKFIPLIWQKSELEKVVKEVSFGANHNTDEQVKQSILERARGDLRIEIQENDVEVTRFNDRVRVRVVWRPLVRLVWAKTFQPKFEVVESTTFY
jgi:hypothetical protein